MFVLLLCRGIDDCEVLDVGINFQNIYTQMLSALLYHQSRNSDNAKVSITKQGPAHYRVNYYYENEIDTVAVLDYKIAVPAFSFEGYDESEVKTNLKNLEEDYFLLGKENPGRTPWDCWVDDYREGVDKFFPEFILNNNGGKNEEIY